MKYYEVLVADGRYRGETALTYSSDESLSRLCLVSIPLRGRIVNGFVLKKVAKPTFSVRPIKASQLLQIPSHLIKLAEWISAYYGCSLGEALRQLAPSGTAARSSKVKQPGSGIHATSLSLESKLTAGQAGAINKIKRSKLTTILLHGETGSGKTRVYLELAADAIKSGRSAIILTPEIALTAQLAAPLKKALNSPVFTVHSKLSLAQRKQIWRQIASSEEPVVVIGARSALFVPIKKLGLIVVDEAHEPAYKQDQSPRYNANRVASMLAKLAGAKAVLGTATPNVADYFLAQSHHAVVRLTQPAIKGGGIKPDIEIVDLTDKAAFSPLPYLSKRLLKTLRQTLDNKKQALIYLNRRGSARIIMCSNCGWRLLCPYCDISMVYHGDKHEARCHTCGHLQSPPTVCPKCRSSDIIYKSGGTKLLADLLAAAFPHHRIQRFDSDNEAGEGVHELYEQLRLGKIDILVGTQLLAKGLDLPKLELVGIINADTSLSMPDFTAGERTFQLIYQVAGRVSRGHGAGKVVLQSYNPNSPILQASLDKDWESFKTQTLKERERFDFPPYSHLLKLTCRRRSAAGAKKAAAVLKSKLAAAKLPVEILGPAPSFYSKRGGFFYWQLVVKSKKREHLLKLTRLVPAGCSVDLDPSDLL